MKYLRILFLGGLFLLLNLSLSQAKEPLQPHFKITGYIEKISPDSIQVYVPRMKQALSLLLARNLEIKDFVYPDNKTQYSLADLKEKDMAVFEGVINQRGFVCQIISFVSTYRQEG